MLFRSAVEDLVLAQTKDVPADATVVIIAGPTTDFFPPELEMLKRYLDRGGHLLALLDPNTTGAPQSPKLEALLAQGEGHDVLVVVGALHLLGEDGVVERLRRQGHAVERMCTACTSRPRR